MANLLPKQRAALIEWAAEGLRVAQINQRAAEFDPPFHIHWGQLKNARQRSATKFSKMQAALEADATTQGLARRAARIMQIAALYDKHLELIVARGEEMAQTKEIAGGETGLLVRDYRGKDADQAVYKYDPAPIKEMRGLLDDIAREMGDRRTKIDLRAIDVTKLSDEELEAIARAESEG